MNKWQPVPGFEGLYKVSNTGRVVRLRGDLELKPTPHVRGGYLFVNLRKDGKQHHRKIHRLVCEAFNGPSGGSPIVRHLDDNPLNNNANNLAWGSAGDNLRDAVRNGGHAWASRNSCSQGHLYDDQNTYINPASGERVCRICSAGYKRAYKARKTAINVES